MTRPLPDDPIERAAAAIVTVLAEYRSELESQREERHRLAVSLEAKLRTKGERHDAER